MAVTLDEMGEQCKKEERGGKQETGELHFI